MTIPAQISRHFRAPALAKQTAGQGW